MDAVIIEVDYNLFIMIRLIQLLLLQTNYEKKLGVLHA